MKTNTQTDPRFATEAGKYVAYLESPEGRLRLDLAFANLQEFLPVRKAKRALCALDIGGGTGAIAIRLARLGVQVTLLDSSLTMLDIAKGAAREANVSALLTLKHSDATELPNLFNARSFDVIVCHNLLEYVDDAHAVLRGAVGLMRGSAGILSILLRNRAGEVLKTALNLGDLDAAEACLKAEWAQESLYGGRVRLFTEDAVEALLKRISLTTIAQRGVRVAADYLPRQISRASQYERILSLERQLGKRPEFTAIARYTQWLAASRAALPEAGE